MDIYQIEISLSLLIHCKLSHFKIYFSISDRQTWPKNRPEYLHFALHKCNMDTTNVVTILSKLFR